MRWKRSTAAGDLATTRIGAGVLALLLWLVPPAPPRHGLGGPPAVGSVSGTVRLAVPAPARPAMLSPYARPRYRAPARQESAASPENVVVYLRPAAPAPPAAGVVARVTQRNRTILPHVTVVRAGTRVEFPNEDDVFHNIFSLSGPKRFNLGRYPPGESHAEVFSKAGVVRLFCDIHSEMNGIIVVVDTPYFTQPDADGRFRIADVPEGEYTAVVWHESAGADSTSLVVRPGADTEVSFTLGR